MILNYDLDCLYDLKIYHWGKNVIRLFLTFILVFKIIYLNNIFQLEINLS